MDRRIGPLDSQGTTGASRGGPFEARRRRRRGRLRGAERSRRASNGSRALL